MRILFLSGLYSTPLAPKQGIPNARILARMRAHAEDIRVLAPLPWYPRALTRRMPSLAALQDIPATEPDHDGSTVKHPRWINLPRVGGSLQAGLYAASVLAPLRAEVARFKPDVLMSAWAYPDGTAAVLLGKLLGLPTVVRVMGSDINDYGQRPGRRWQIARAMGSADRVIAVSAALGRETEALGVDRSRIRVIPTGVDTDAFQPTPQAEARAALGLAEPPPGQRLVLVPSRLSREKGIHVFLDAMAAVAPTVHAVICGDGNQEQPLRAQCEQLGLSQRVQFAGFQPAARMKHYYAAADLVCLPSLEEGWPNVLMESFACGCPVVASEVGGVPEIIALTGAGLAAPAGDASGLASAIEAVLARDFDRAAIAETMQGHTLEITARRYYEACLELTGGR